MSIDVHAHVIPAAVLEHLEAEGGRYGIEVTTVGGTRRAQLHGRDLGWDLRSDLTELEPRLAAMEAAGVETQLLSSWVDLTAYELPGDVGARYARMFNTSLAELVADHPGRFRGLGTVPLQDPQRAALELHHVIGELGMVGAEIATTVDGRELDDPDLDPFWAAAEELRAILLVHPLRSLTGRSVRRHFLGNMVGNPAETTIAIGHLVLGGVLERFPELVICVVHGGGFLPYQRGRLDHGFEAKPGLVAANVSQPPSAYLRRLYYDTVLHDPATLAWLVEFAGPDHVVMGSDYPFEMGDHDPVGTVGAIPGLEEADRVRILRGNLEALMARVGAPDTSEKRS